MNVLCNKGVIGKLTLCLILTLGMSAGFNIGDVAVNPNHEKSGAVAEPIVPIFSFGLVRSALAQGSGPEVSPSVGAVLKQASDHLGSQKFGPAAAVLRAGLGASGLTEFEVFSIHRLLIGAELSNQQFAQVIESGRLVLSSPFLKDSEKPYIRQSLITANFKLSKFADAAQLAEAGLKSNPQDLSLLEVRLKSLYLAKKYVEAAGAVEDYLKASSGNKPSEDILKIYAHSASESDAEKQYVSALMQLVQYYPSSDYWSDLLYRKNASGVFQKLGEIQFYRLLQATQSFKDPGEFIDAAELAIKAGFPVEAGHYLDTGVQLGLLPNKELQAVYNDKRKQIAGLIQQDVAALEAKAVSKVTSKATAPKNAKSKPISALIAEGYNLVLQGQKDSGLEALQTALAQAQGKPEVTSARLAYALGFYKAGKSEDAIREFKLLKSDAPDIANLWLAVFNVK
ncbi:MAG: tetratricopeptide repeat protein [Limnobacter sp.]|nr:tetratricopeptide repeat protein [Limnobacter sp.]